MLTKWLYDFLNFNSQLINSLGEEKTKNPRTCLEPLEDLALVDGGRRFNFTAQRDVDFCVVLKTQNWICTSF